MSKYLKIKSEDELDLVRRVVIHRMGEVSEQQASEMLHAIGADQKKAREYLGHLTYHAYRNYYHPGGADVDLWNDLVDKGYSDKQGPFYHVSVDGLTLLEKLTGATIYDDYDCVADCKTRVLKTFMRIDVSVCYGSWLPVSVKQIANNLKIPERLARETVRYLEANGYVAKSHYGGVDEDGCVYCIHGYVLTDKTRQTETWKMYHAEEMARVKKMLTEADGKEGDKVNG